MQLTPRYGPVPIIVLDGPPGAVLAPALRQYRRLVDTLASFTDDQWSNPSRCEGWPTKDVIARPPAPARSEGASPIVLHLLRQERDGSLPHDQVASWHACRIAERGQGRSRRSTRWPDTSAISSKSLSTWSTVRSASSAVAAIRRSGTEGARC